MLWQRGSQQRKASRGTLGQKPQNNIVKPLATSLAFAFVPGERVVGADLVRLDLRTSALKGGKTTWYGSVALTILACLDVPKTEALPRQQIVRHLTNEYDTECRAVLRRRYPPPR